MKVDVWHQVLGLQAKKIRLVRVTVGSDLGSFTMDLRQGRFNLERVFVVPNDEPVIALHRKTDTVVFDEDSQTEIDLFAAHSAFGAMISLNEMRHEVESWASGMMRRQIYASAKRLWPDADKTLAFLAHDKGLAWLENRPEPKVEEIVARPEEVENVRRLLEASEGYGEWA
jgi:hypothetical protein